MSTRTTLIALLLASGCAAFAGQDEKPLPKELPPYGADRAIPPIDLTRKTLANGMEVWIVKRPGLPRVASYLAVRGGDASDPADRQGLSSFMAGLLAEGTARRSSRQIAEEIQAIGGELAAGAGPDAVLIHGTALSSGLGTLVNLLADVARHPAFPAKEVELSKANALQGLQAQEAQPGFKANRAFFAALFGEHPYRFTAITPELVKQVTPEQLRALHGERFQPGRALLVLSGDLQPAAALKAVEAAFGDWKATAPDLKPVPPAPTAAARQIVLVPRPGSVQSTLRVGRPAIPFNHADYVPFQLANIILGGSFHSRITRNIREDKGYTYSPAARLRSLREGGAYLVQADVRNDVTAATLNEIFYEMDRMASTDVHEEELVSAKRYMAGTFLAQNEMLQALTGTLATYWINGQQPEALSAFIPKVNAVTAADIRRVSRTWLASKDQTVVVVGDPAKAKAELEQYGLVTVK
ncbi:M16 family metallopeptidase [Mesoterricola sediminis]|uniref:Peptidase M16 n=1 Tax=Mesoterricola sediminis TaxID=2927980 RepID=A0AA48GWQ3_9BACT|nr:pitrilysin family protein [Mesoterricola sediminis]BDU75810.1 peptidase M16 [Mesoterricola sediminis]